MPVKQQMPECKMQVAVQKTTLTETKQVFKSGNKLSV